MSSPPAIVLTQTCWRQHTGAVLDSVSRKVGFRRLRVVRAPLDDPAESGRTFLFELNGVPLFVGGSNWIPIDSVVTNASRDRYRRWLELAREGNQTMVRVWGGGLYEDEAFYEGCVRPLTPSLCSIRGPA